MRNPFRYFNSSPEVIRLAVMMYVRFPLSLRQVEDLLHERGIDICHGASRGAAHRAVLVEPVRPDVRRGDPEAARSSSIVFPMATAPRRALREDQRRDALFVAGGGSRRWITAVDHESEVLEVFETKRRDRKAALKFIKRTMKRYGRPWTLVTDRLRSYGAAMKSEI